MEGGHERACSRCCVLARHGGALSRARDFELHEYFGVSFVRPRIHVCARHIGTRECRVFGCRCLGGLFSVLFAQFPRCQYRRNRAFSCRVFGHCRIVRNPISLAACGVVVRCVGRAWVGERCCWRIALSLLDSRYCSNCHACFSGQLRVWLCGLAFSHKHRAACVLRGPHRCIIACA